MAKKKGEDIMKEQEENKAENDKRIPEANFACQEKGIERKTCMDTSAKKKLLVRHEDISPTRLSEMINKEVNDFIKRINNINDAVQTLVKCSMEEKKPILPCSKESKGMSDVCQSQVLKEYKKLYNVCINQQTTCHALRWHNNLSTYDNSCLCTTTHESAISLSIQNKIKENERKNEKHSKSVNNVNTDNGRMTGNINVYICSKTNDNDQNRDRKKRQFYTDTSSNNTITEQSNSRSASNASTCKLINSIKEKRKKSLTQQLSNFIHEKSSNDNIICDNRTSQHKKSEADSKEEADVKVNDENVQCKDTTSLSKNGCYCKDTDIDKNNDRDVHGNHNKYTMCHAVNSSRWLPKSICIDCVTYGEDSKKCFADGCKFRNKILQNSIINRNNIRNRQIGYKFLQQPLGREQMPRQWFTCSCITEEGEDYCKGVDRDCKGIDRNSKELPQNTCNVAECLKKISVCQTPRKLAESVVVCETLFDAPGKCFEKTRTCKDSTEYSKGTSICGIRFRNSEEPSKVTRVCKEFVEPAEDITVCKTVFDEPNGLPEEVIVYKTALSDSKDIPKETICKEIPDLNFASQVVKRMFLNDAKDKLVEESTNSSNLNSPEGNANNNNKIIKLNNKHDVALDSFMEQQFVEKDKQITLNDQSKNLRSILTESIKDSKPLSKNVYSTLPRAQFYNRSNLASNSNVKKISKTLVNQKKTLNRSMRNFQQSNDLTQNLAPNKNNQLEEKTQEKEEKQDVLKEMKTIENKQRESLLHRPFKKLIDVIRRGRIFVTDRIETGKTETKKAITNDKKDVEKLEIASETEDKTNDIKDQREIVEKVAVFLRPQTEIADKGKKMDIQRTDQTMPKLLRIIAAKKSHVLPTIMTIDSKPQEPEIISVLAEVITAHVEEIPEEKITLQEHSPAKVTEEIKDDSIASEISVAVIETSVEDVVPKDVVDEDRVPQDIPQDILNETTKTHVACPQKKPEEESQKPIPCKCSLPSEPNGYPCSITKCTKDHMPCPQKKSEEEPQKSTLCKRKLSSNNFSCSIKYLKCNNIIEDCLCKNNKVEQKKIYCARCRLSTMQCICTSYLKSCLKTDKPKFCSVSPLRISSHICTNCCRTQKERKCKKTRICCSYEKCRCKRCIRCGDCSRIDKHNCGSQTSCINCGRPRNQCCCATFTLIKCHKIKEGCNRTMICLYCDNPQDKCTCRASIGKCLYCGLPTDVCNCQDNEDCARDCERIVRRPDENRTICVTSWKPKREIRQYLARNYDNFQSYSTKECHCYEKPKRRPEELPYQRLNIFSEVMNELQQKMSESVCCAQCWKNPCCCGSLVDQDKRKKERKAENRVKREIEKSSASKSSNNCQCSPSPRNEHIQKSTPIRHIGCVCKLTCRCRKDRSYTNYKKPLAKCYYCKSLPCTPNEARTRTSCCCFFIAFFAAAALL